MLKIFVTVD